MAALDVTEIHERLEKAVTENNFHDFRSSYLRLLSRNYAFQESLADGPSEVPVRDSIFGSNVFYLKQTNDEQGDKILTQGRAASSVWGAMPLSERLDFLKVLQKKLEEHAQEIMLVITSDTGKPIDLSQQEMGKGNEWFQYAYDEAENQIGDKVGRQQKISTRPLGAAQIIGAYNYPYALAIGGIIGALTTGNGVVVSAPLKAPNWVFPFMQAAREAVEEFSAMAIREEKPWAGDFAKISRNLIQYSVGVNRKLTANADVVHFVGSDNTGNMIANSRKGKKTILEMGGTNVVAVMASAIGNVGTPEAIAKTIYDGFGPATGQRCTAPRILYVEQGAEEVVHHLTRICAEAKHQIGNPYTKGVKVGPLVDGGAHQGMVQAIALAEELGADVHGKLKVSDAVMPQAHNGNSFWVNPIVIDWRNVNMEVSDNRARVDARVREEIFGPLLNVVHSVKDLGEAIAKTNKLDSHGLAGAIFTANENDVDRYQSGTNITSITVNGAPKDRSPWGPHGHPGLDVIGGPTHFGLYGKRVTVAGVAQAAKPVPSAA